MRPQLLTNYGIAGQVEQQVGAWPRGGPGRLDKAAKRQTQATDGKNNYVPLVGIEPTRAFRFKIFYGNFFPLFIVTTFLGLTPYPVDDAYM